MPSLPRPSSRRGVVVLSGGAVTALLSAGLAVGVWPDGAPAPDRVAAAAPNALGAEASLRLEERITRDRVRSVPTATATATATAPAPTATAPKPTAAAVPKAVGLLWVTSAVNVRSGPSAAGKPIGSLAAVTKVGVTGATKDGWSQVVVAGRAGWVKSSYLSKTKPEPAEESTPNGVSDASCSISSDVEKHLTANARGVYRAVCAAYGDEVSSFGGYRAGDDGDHGTGRAVDIMVSGDPGLDIAKYVQAHASELHVTYVIYQQKMWMAGDAKSDWELMEDRGSTTANHYDHVHVSVS